VRAAIDAGGAVLLLVSLATMHGFDVPHWVVCHGAVPGAIVLDDPWSSPATGDTWVSAHQIPVRDDELDAMSSMEAEGWRGAVLLGATAGHRRPPGGVRRA
jgi:hypothetical protein